MRYMNRICSGAFALALAGLWCEEADATPLPPLPPTCHSCEVCGKAPPCTTIPARYTSGAAGEVAVIQEPSTGATTDQQFVAAIVGALGQLTAHENGEPSVHAKQLFDGSGNKFTETIP